MKLVARYENQDDGRAKLVCLTKRGANLAKKLVPIVEAVDTEFFAQLNIKENKGLIGTMQKLME